MYRPSAPDFPRLRQTVEDRKLLEQSRATVERSHQLLTDTAHLVDAHRLSPTLTGNAVSMMDTGREWHVLVKEAGVGTIARTFSDRLSAFNFAECQAMRLGLEKVICT
ncbi:MAG: hypothetical protein E5X48_07265 [Mesorhizobium sp.]|uniref:hypothetical protein n=1 Tax=Mesorhizobium sp. TaxID=1871066 RepID=UPI001207CB3E|nr:hypothetical protein [Mesorhizobium sp.]TIQ37157.1 MAG: hypothetical protein E5X48_07265 [Mesorhizobium sp.]